MELVALCYFRFFPAAEDLEKPKRTFVVFWGETKVRTEGSEGSEGSETNTKLGCFFWGGVEQMVIVDDIGGFLKWGHRRYPEIIQDI